VRSERGINNNNNNNDDDDDDDDVCKTAIAK
jgi:hypothetical protein